MRIRFDDRSWKDPRELDDVGAGSERNDMGLEPLQRSALYQNKAFQIMRSNIYQAALNQQEARISMEHSNQTTKKVVNLFKGISKDGKPTS